MKTMAVIIGSALVAFAGQAAAAITVNIHQDGSDLVVSSSGTLNSLVCTSIDPGWVSDNNHMVPSSPSELAFGPIGSVQEQCVGTSITPTTGFGTGVALENPANSGVSYFFEPAVGGGFWGPSGWDSTTLFTSSMIFPNASIASAGLNPGSSVYTFANGGVTDTLTINVHAPLAASIPVPTLSWWGILFLIALIMLTSFSQFRDRRTKTRSRKRFRVEVE